jgi:glycosyltransferase 2 family protein
VSRNGPSAGSLLRVAFLVAAALGIGVALHRLWPEVSAALASASWGAIVLRTGLALVFQLTALAAWRTTLTELGSPVPLASAVHIYLVSQLGKYVPGSIWAGVAMVRLGQDVSIPRSRTAYSFVLSLAFSLLTGLAIGGPALIAHGDYLPLALTALVALSVVLLWPRLLNGILDRGLRLARRGRLERPLSGRGIARIVGLYVLAWIAGGLHIWLLSAAVGELPASPLPSIAAFAVATTLGTLFVIAPAGAGVRDVLMVLILSPATGVAAATAVAVLSRAILTLLDVAGAGAASLAWRRIRPSAPDPEPAPRLSRD